MTRFLVPVRDQGQAGLVRLVNARQMKLTVEPISELQSPAGRAVRAALLTAATTSVVYLVFILYEEARREKLKLDIEELNEKLRNLEVKGESGAEEQRAALKNVSRYKILLLARLSDYSKELDFWRDTIRKILYQATHEAKTAETIITQVSQSLKTYGTHDRHSDDFEVITTLATMISAAEKQDS